MSSNKHRMPCGGYPMGPWDEAHYRGTVAEDYPHTVKGNNLNERIVSDDRATRYQAKEEQAFDLKLEAMLADRPITQSEEECTRQCMEEWNKWSWLKVIRVGEVEL